MRENAELRAEVAALRAALAAAGGDAAVAAAAAAAVPTLTNAAGV